MLLDPRGQISIFHFPDARGGALQCTPMVSSSDRCRALAMFAVWTMALVGVLAAPRAQQPAAQAPAPPLKPLVPVAASTLASNPDAYLGENVTVVGAVEQILSPSAFSIDQSRGKSTADTVLILTPTLSAPVTADTYVTVIGVVVRFDPAETARTVTDRALDIPPDAAATYRGRPAIIATSVINAAMIDLAKRVPPPPTPAENAFDNTMKKIGPAFTALRQGVDGADAAAVTAQATIMKQGFVEAGAFWKARGKAEPTTWSQDAARLADAVDKAAATGHWDEAKTSATALGRTCQTCHGAYRERLDDGTYRVK